MMTFTHRPTNQHPLHYQVAEDELRYIILMNLSDQVKEKMANIKRCRPKKEASLLLKCSIQGFFMDLAIETTDGMKFLSRNFMFSGDVDQDRIYSEIISGGHQLLVILPKGDSTSSIDASDPRDSGSGLPLHDRPRKFLSGIFFRKNRGKKIADQGMRHYTESLIHL